MKKITPLLFLFLTMSSITFAQISDIEKNALLDLYNSTNGKDWNNTWNVSESAENWQGITISNNAVIEINLSMNNLEGVLPASIGWPKSVSSFKNSGIDSSLIPSFCVRTTKMA